MPTPNLSRDARNFIEKLPHKHAKQVLVKVLDLCRNPEPPDSSLLKGSREGYRRAGIGECDLALIVPNSPIALYRTFCSQTGGRGSPSSLEYEGDVTRIPPPS